MILCPDRLLSWLCVRGALLSLLSLPALHASGAWCHAVHCRRLWLKLCPIRPCSHRSLPSPSPSPAARVSRSGYCSRRWQSCGPKSGALRTMCAMRRARWWPRHITTSRSLSWLWKKWRGTRCLPPVPARVSSLLTCSCFPPAPTPMHSLLICFYFLPHVPTDVPSLLAHFCFPRSSLLPCRPVSAFLGICAVAACEEGEACRRSPGWFLSKPGLFCCATVLC